MPIRSNKDPYANPFDGLNKDVNVFVSKIIDAMENDTLPIILGEKLKTTRGKWLNTINEKAKTPKTKLILEIGCHFGHSLVQMAEENPETGFVGFDITFKRVYKAAHRCTTAGHDNMISAFGNCSDLTPFFEENELDGIVIFFPDPWEKKERQQKHRLLSKDFCKSLQTVLKPGGFLWLKTDHDSYYEQSCSILDEAGMKVAENKPDFGRHPYTSCFEEKFTEKGMPTHQNFWLN